jgi:hypothetical protein
MVLEYRNIVYLSMVAPSLVNHLSMVDLSLVSYSSTLAAARHHLLRMEVHLPLAHLSHNDQGNHIRLNRVKSFSISNKPRQHTTLLNYNISDLQKVAHLRAGSDFHLVLNNRNLLILMLICNDNSRIHLQIDLHNHTRHNSSHTLSNDLHHRDTTNNHQDKCNSVHLNLSQDSNTRLKRAMDLLHRME